MDTMAAMEELKNPKIVNCWLIPRAKTSRPIILAEPMQQ